MVDSLEINPSPYRETAPALGRLPGERHRAHRDLVPDALFIIESGGFRRHCNGRTAGWKWGGMARGKLILKSDFADAMPELARFCAHTD